MRLLVTAIGRLKSGPERELAERYRKRAADAGRQIGVRNVDVIEIRESRAGEREKRVLEESIALATVIPDNAVIVALDERGHSLDSGAIAGQLRAWRDSGRPVVAFVVGGADGLADEIKQRATLTLAFGAATWPHQLVRIMLLEQLYRVVTILAGHPYHRA
jgi:23S rRNA (pseudouridine1915-N3)-methyltransferase